MEICELIHILIGLIDRQRCPFCTDPKDTDTYTTYKGESNSSGKLRKIMNDPDCLVSEQNNARPKSGQGRFQVRDTAQPNPNPIFEDNTTMFPGLSGPIGAYGDEAHHCISGNECMKGELIENIIKDEARSEYEKDTGYSINNCANGVYLPSWHRNRFGSGKADGTWADLNDGKNYDAKYEIMKLAMRGGAGQAHIGSHEGKTTPKHHHTYPSHVKRELGEIKKRVELRQEDCPYCKEKGQPKKPAPAPYGVNQWLDGLSHRIKGHLTGHPRSWEYFVSQYAADYHNELCRHGTLAAVLPDNWPPL